jgi:hypothetical protein
VGRHRGDGSRALLAVLALVLAAPALIGACKRKEDRSTREDRFTEGFAAQLRQELPDARMRITIKEPLLLDVALGDGGITTVSLDNPFRDCHGEIEGCQAAESEARVLTQMNPGEDSGDPAMLRPVLKDARWMAGFEETLKDTPPDKQAGNRLVTAPFVADLVIVYVFDMPDGMRMVTERDRQKLGLERAAVDALARKNLDAAMPGAMPDEEIAPRIHQVHIGDSYEASRILLDDRWRAPARAVKGDLLVAVPSRDYVFYTGSREGDAVLTRFRALIREFEGTRGHPISLTILKRAAAGWRVFAP